MIGSSSFVCLDFSLDRLAAVEVAEGRVVKWTVQPLVAGSLRGGDPIDTEQLAGELKSALARAGITARKARIAISDDAAVVRVISVPRMPKRHLGSAIRFLSEQETPFPAGRASLAWHVIERGQNTTRIYLAAAWKDVVQRLADAVRAAGLEPEVIEPRSLAVNRAIGRDDAIIIDAGEMVARLTYVSRTETPFADQVPVLGDGKWGAANLMLERALRSHRGTVPNVLLAGDFEAAASSPEAALLSVSAHTASAALNGHGPARPAGMPGGALLGPLGLAVRGLHVADRAPYPEVNLLAGGRAADLSRSGQAGSATAPSRPRRRLVVAAAVAGVLAIWSVVGVGLASLLGALPHLPLGP
jgi:Type IV pilus assembly protein PilM